MLAPSRRIAVTAAVLATVLGSAASAATASAADAATPTVVHAATVTPNDVGAVKCGGEVLCIQRVTSIINNVANIKAWAYDVTWKGHFELVGPDGHIADSKTSVWVAGGTGYTFTNVPKGAGYTIIAWQGSSTGPWSEIGSVGFSV